MEVHPTASPSRITTRGSVHLRATWNAASVEKVAASEVPIQELSSVMRSFSRHFIGYKTRRKTH